METFHRVQAKLEVAAVALTTTFLMLNCAVAHTPTPLYLYKPYLVLVPLSLALGSSSVLFFFGSSQEEARLGFSVSVWHCTRRQSLAASLRRNDAGT